MGSHSRVVLCVTYLFLMSFRCDPTFSHHVKNYNPNPKSQLPRPHFTSTFWGFMRFYIEIEYCHPPYLAKSSRKPENIGISAEILDVSVDGCLQNGE